MWTLVLSSPEDICYSLTFFLENSGCHWDWECRFLSLILIFDCIFLIAILNAYYGKENITKYYRKMDLAAQRKNQLKMVTERSVELLKQISKNNVDVSIFLAIRQHKYRYLLKSSSIKWRSTNLGVTSYKFLHFSTSSKIYFCLFVFLYLLIVISHSVASQDLKVSDQSKRFAKKKLICFLHVGIS